MDKNKFVITLHVMSVVSILVCLFLIYTDTRSIQIDDPRAIFMMIILIIGLIGYLASLIYGIYYFVKK